MPRITMLKDRRKLGPSMALSDDQLESSGSWVYSMQSRAQRSCSLPPVVLCLEFRQVLDIHLVGAMQRIEKAWLFIVTGRPWHPVPRVVHLRANHRRDTPHVHEEEVRFAGKESSGEWDEVGDDELDGVAVDRHQALPGTVVSSQ